MSLPCFYHLLGVLDVYPVRLLLGVHFISWNTLSSWFTLCWRLHSWSLMFCFHWVFPVAWLSFSFTFLPSVADSGFSWSSPFHNLSLSLLHFLYDSYCLGQVLNVILGLLLFLFWFGSSFLFNTLLLFPRCHP